jgi:hypothetical protein
MLQASEKLLLDAGAAKVSLFEDTTLTLVRNIFKDYFEANARAYYTFSSKCGLGAGYLVRDFTDEGLMHEIDVLARIQTLVLNVRQDFGYGEPGTKISAGIGLWNAFMTEGRINESYLRYTFSDSLAQYSWVNELTVDLRPPVSWWDAHLGFEVLRNRFYNYDTRVLLSTSIRFSRFSK